MTEVVNLIPGEALPVAEKKARKPRVKKVKEADVQQAIPIVSPGEAIAIHPVAAQAAAVAEREGEVRKDHRGLSPSSLSLFQGCARKYYLKKVAKVPIDDDASTDTEAFDIGKAFHKVLEDNMHVLTGVGYSAVKKVVVDTFKLTENFHLPMIFAMLGKYKTVHERSGLKAIACEVELDTEEFYGFVDVILQNPEDGSWWISDMKTAGTFSPGTIPTLPSHQQLNLYAYHYKLIAEKLSLDTVAFRGIRYRVTTKARIGRKKDEAVEAFIKRLSESVKSYDIAIPKEKMNPGIAYGLHAYARKFIASQEEHDYPANPGNCMAYFRPCEFWSKCHGNKYSSCGDNISVLEV